MDQQQMKTILKETFDAVSNGYDGKALRFFSESARNMAALLYLRGDEHVLDVACGTGHASIAIAHMLPAGRVTAVDFSAGMLAQARQKTASMNIGNIEFREGDMQNLEFPDSSFDAAVCSFGIFFVEDMGSQLDHIASKVRPGGRIMITSFLKNYFSPLKEKFFDRIVSFGVPSPPQTWKSIAHEAGCRQLFEQSGIGNIRVETRNVGYYLDSSDDWWSVVWNAGLRRMVTRLSLSDQERFKKEHLEEIELLRTDKGIWLDVGVLYTAGTKV